MMPELTQLRDFAKRYTGAWCSQKALSVAAFFAPNGSLSVNGAPAVPGGTGHGVRFSGYEVWKFGEDGLVAESQGHFDAAAYQRQLERGVEESR